uniref:Uncharacterized protein n=1 Tax=Anguilla anguilla TaxID=7936 RepID=A0A0E9QKV9_ANGAN
MLNYYPEFKRFKKKSVLLLR